MQVTLNAFSIVHIAPPSYKTPYAVGIAQDEGGKRILVRIKTDNFDDLMIGMEGEVVKEKVDDRELNIFHPQR